MLKKVHIVAHGFRHTEKELVEIQCISVIPIGSFDRRNKFLNGIVLDLLDDLIDALIVIIEGLAVDLCFFGKLCDRYLLDLLFRKQAPHSEDMNGMDILQK